MAEDANGLKEVPASEVLDKIKKGVPIEYDHVVIKGDMDVRTLDLPKEKGRSSVRSSIKISNSRIDGNIYFSDTIINEPINISCTLLCDTYFSGTEFKGKANFNKSQFSNISGIQGFVNKLEKRSNVCASFQRAVFEGDADFSGAQFIIAKFDNTIFAGGANFQNARFVKPSDFRYSMFNVGKIDFNKYSFQLANLAYSYSCQAFAEEKNYYSALQLLELELNLPSDYNESWFETIEKISKKTIRKLKYLLNRIANKINKKSNCVRLKFRSSIYAMKIRFRDGLVHIKAQFKKPHGITVSPFEGASNFGHVEFGSYVHFGGSLFNCNANFEGCIFGSIADFDYTQFRGEILTFKNAKFKYPYNQEDACRRAKNLFEVHGNKEESDYHYYREMNGKRKQKPFYIRYPEYIFIQSMFGYGVHPFRLIAVWALIVMAFGVVYWWGNGVENASHFFDYIEFSFSTAIAPGYLAAAINPGSIGYKPSSIYQVVAMTEAVFGTFSWAAFITTFAKKYMR